MRVPACLVCEAPDTVPDAGAERRCRRCGFGFATAFDEYPAPDYEALYAGPGQALEAARRPHFEAVLARIRPFGGRRLLDVGCGGGLFVRLAARDGWTAIGVDPAVRAEDGAGYRLMRAPFPPPEGLPGGAFALVTFLGSLNHMRDTLHVLRAAHRLLEPGGMALIRVPNAAMHARVARAVAALGVSSRLGGWLAGGVVRHPRAFTARSLAVALTRAGFDDVRVDVAAPTPGDPYGTGAVAIGLVKTAVGRLARAAAALSGRRLLWSPSLEAWGVRSRC